MNFRPVPRRSGCSNQGAGVFSFVTQDARNRIALHELTAQLFHEQSQKGTSGDGAILVCPWDPTFLYRLTWNGAWVWAKAVQSGMATREIPPRTYEYLAIMKKAHVYHKATSVNDRVKMRGAQLQLELSPTFHRAGGSREAFFDNPAKLLFQTPATVKRSASFAGLGVSDKEHKAKCLADVTKKIKYEPGSPSKKNMSKAITIHLSSDPPSAKKFEVKQEPGVPIVISSDPPSKGQFKSSQISFYAHAEALEHFLDHCNVPHNDNTTRMILKSAGVNSWTDLIPSVQFTKTSLTARGMHPDLAAHLLSEAMERVNVLKGEDKHVPDEESPELHSDTNRPPSPEF
ncbi:uncharacterized protein MELLADRAFT_94639 [Melampsora larici-populina 98AG31]|uniref:Uncharacterized protein n=1 Tax=Melampsora larici-populina (strain 98AG31 / pathotype 3-4-7) TaxID=747676 RepID=F4S7F3_MELLP|nr:uncharacterized protein MELLADRAFT_94639 [Melampsora larici-populina 98AG31]EGF99397.1 hypothetical protein MELLADRAFT_94639 [Melampsora larici-populina 98AG31]